jgi:hypothetical protein
MRKKLDENDRILKWPPVFREGIKITDHNLGILEVSRHGETEITAEDYEQMEKFGYIHVRTNFYKIIPKHLKGHIKIQDEEDFSDFLVTSVTFRRYEAPPLENGGKSDRHILKKTKPQQTEIGVGPRDSVCSGCTVDTDHRREDDLSR